MRGNRTPVMIHAGDPLSAAGAKAQLMFQPEVEVLGPADYGRARVAVLILETVDESITKVIQAVRRGGVPKVVVVAARLEEAGVVAATAAGVAAFLRRADATSVRLVALIREVDRAGCQLPEGLVQRAASMQLHPSAGAAPRALAVARDEDGAVATRPQIEVSDREADILRLIADGCDTAEVAEHLAFSESTIKNALARMMERFEARNRCQALAMAMRQGVI